MRLFRRGERASTLDLLVAGLGNPGREYEQTRHNAGWIVLDELARRHGGSWRSKFSGSLSELRVGEAKVALLKPETYMNESGRSLGTAARFFKVDPERVLVVHDDVDLETGRLQARAGGGLAGHNGLRSLAPSPSGRASPSAPSSPSATSPSGSSPSSSSSPSTSSGSGSTKRVGIVTVASTVSSGSSR